MGAFGRSKFCCRIAKPNSDHFTVDGGWVLGDAQGNGNHYGAGQAYNGTTEVAVGARYKF